MRFTTKFLEELKDSGKNVCIFSEKFLKYFDDYSYLDFPKFSSRLYYYWKNGEKAIPLEIVIEVMEKKNLNSIEIDYFSIGGGNRITPPDEKKISFYYLLGLILGDGCLVHSKRGANKHTYLLQISFRQEKEAENIKQLIKTLFDVDSSIYLARGCYNLCVFSKPLVLILHKKYQIPLGLKCDSIKIPDIVKRGNKKRIVAFLKGVFDSDGNIYLHRERRCVQLRQKSYHFLKEIQILFMEIKISFNNPYFDKANNSWVLWSSKKNLVDTFINKIVNFKIEALVAQPG